MSNNHKINVGIIGLGYVGLPLAKIFADEGYNVIGFDINTNICEKLNQGNSHIKDVNSSDIKDIINKKQFTATSDFSLLSTCKLVSICVPTPLNKTNDPDLKSVISATQTISEYLTDGQMVVLESTTYPGTTTEIVLPILEQKGKTVGEDFYLCFSPERVDPGNQIWNTKNTPKILGGITSVCLNKVYNIYSKVFDNIVKVSNTETAELVKVYENTFRMINIALANEISLVCDKLNLNVWEVIDAASTKPFGFMKFLPGPGLGGHCIPLDPHYLSWKMRTLSFKTRMIEIASEINSKMPEKIHNKVLKKLNELSKSVNGSKILVIGIAYKKDIDDLRESPALDIIKLLQNSGAFVSYHDPYCPEIKDDFHTDLKNLPMNSIDLSTKAIKESDLILIVTDHSNIDYKLISENAQSIIDTRGVLRKNNE